MLGVREGVGAPRTTPGGGTHWSPRIGVRRLRPLTPMGPREAAAACQNTPYMYTRAQARSTVDHLSVCRPRVGLFFARAPLLMATFAPTRTDLEGFTDIDAIAAWLEMEQEVIEALATAAGAKGRSLRSWARIPTGRWSNMITTLKVTTDLGQERSLTPIEEGQVGELQTILGTLAGGGALPASAIHGGQGGSGTATGAERPDDVRGAHLAVSEQPEAGPLARHCQAPPLHALGRLGLRHRCCQPRA